MKIFLTGFTLIICMHISAQTIQPTASAQECLTFIENTLKVITVDKPDIKTTIYFRGTQVTLDHAYSSSSVFRYAYQNVDWAKYNKLGRSPSEGNTAILFDFSAPFPMLRQSYYDGKLTDLTVRPEDYILFTIRQSDTSKIKEIEIAAARLAEIARGKSSPLLEIKPPKTPADGKPTYKETVSFIKSYFNTDNRKKHSTVATYWYDAGYLTSISYKMLYVEISDCILYIGYETLRTNYMTKAETRNVVNYKIDISKIEDIKVQLTGTRDREVKEQNFVNHLAFKIVDNPTIMLLPFDNIPADAPNNGTQTQIFKAFNHLKKLCGAPEPVVFD